jgi:predicted amidohydrolase
MNVASVQFQHRAGDKSYNLQVVRQFVQQAARQEVKLIVFPECCLSGYWHLRNLNGDKLLALAESVPEGPLCQEVAALASRYAMTIGVGLVEVTVDSFSEPPSQLGGWMPSWGGLLGLAKYFN